MALTAAVAAVACKKVRRVIFGVSWSIDADAAIFAETVGDDKGIWRKMIGFASRTPSLQQDLT
jgi:hypothetical protein